MGEKKGFSGLDDLSTDIDDIIKEHDREDKKNIEQKKECVDNTSDSQDNNTEDSITTSTSNTSKVANDDSKKSSSGLFRWLIAIGVLIFIIIISNNNSSSSDKSLASNTKNYSSNTQTSAYSKPSTDDYYESKPDSYLTTLNKNQLLYCEAEKIRLDFVQNKIDLYSTLEVDKYNNLSNDYNSRCANKQYYKNDMNYVDRNIEKKRYQLQQDGLARFSKSNSESLNSQSYNTNQPKKQTNQKGASSNEKNLCIQKGGKNSWNFELDKPICNINGTEFFYDNLDKSSSTSSLKTNELTQDNELSQTWNEVNPTTIDFATNELDIQETNSWEDLSWTSASTVENNDSQVIDWMVKWLDNTAENDYLNNADLWDSNSYLYPLLVFAWYILLIILNLICYLVNLIHAIRNPIPNKLLWIVLLIVVWITYIAYYFVVKRPFDKAKKQEKNNNISGQNYWFKSEVQDDMIKIGQDDVSFWTGLKKEVKTQDFNFEIK